MRRRLFLKTLLIISVWMLGAFVSLGLAAYSSHQNDEDVSKFLEAYPFARSTRLDDCSLCHPGGTITQNNRTTYYGSCDYCHITYGLTPPHGQVPLNPYGQAYRDAGRSVLALRALETQDSDGDSYLDLQEIQALFFPGDPLDYPGLIQAPSLVINHERILNLKSYSQFYLNNASRSTDWYARYRGVKVSDLLKFAGIRSDATQITVFAPDGFSRTFPIDAADSQTPSNIRYDVNGPYPSGSYYGGLDFVEYAYHPGYDEEGGKIPDKLYMLLGYIRDGDPLTKGKLVPDPANPGRLVLEGEGPYRLLIPQKIAGSPDRSSTASPIGDGWDYDSNKDHNAGSSIRSVTAIRVEPLPSGTTDFNWTEGGWNLVDQAKVVIYGNIAPRTYAVKGTLKTATGEAVEDVRLSFGLVSLGQVGETATDAKGKFQMKLPVGEYVVVPTKAGYTFTPESVPFSLTEKGFTFDFTGGPTP